MTQQLDSEVALHASHSALAYAHPTPWLPKNSSINIWLVFTKCLCSPHIAVCTISLRPHGYCTFICSSSVWFHVQLSSILMLYVWHLLWHTCARMHDSHSCFPSSCSHSSYKYELCALLPIASMSTYLIIQNMCEQVPHHSWHVSHRPMHAQARILPRMCHYVIYYLCMHKFAPIIPCLRIAHPCGFSPPQVGRTTHA
jgi:hypothetical protein